MPSASRARSEARAQAMLKELPLSELREAQHLTQAELAKRLKIGQDAVSKIEHRTDMYLSTLSDFIRAAGSSLELTGRFPAATSTSFASTARRQTPERPGNWTPKGKYLQNRWLACVLAPCA